MGLPPGVGRMPRMSSPPVPPGGGDDPFNYWRAGNAVPDLNDSPRVIDQGFADNPAYSQSMWSITPMESRGGGPYIDNADMNFNKIGPADNTSSPAELNSMMMAWQKGSQGSPEKIQDFNSMLADFQPNDFIGSMPPDFTRTNPDGVQRRMAQPFGGWQSNGMSETDLPSYADIFYRR